MKIETRIYFVFVLATLLTFACKSDKPKSDLSDGQIAILTYYEKGDPIYEVQLFGDSTFKIPNKYKVTKSSSGTFRRNFTRCYFNTIEGQNELCDFYYVDTARKTFWINKGCGDKQNLKMEVYK